jgi:hypothetical protein
MEAVAKYPNGVRILKDWLGSGAFVVDREISQARANVCLTCPHNVKGFAVSDYVAKAIKEHVELKNSLELRVVGEKALYTCDVCACVLKLKIHVPISVIRGHASQDETAKLPPYCWQLTEL